MKKLTFKDMVSSGDWKPRKHKRKGVKVKGKYVFGGYPMGVTPGTGGLPDGGIADGGAVMGEAEEDSLELDSELDVVSTDSEIPDENDLDQEDSVPPTDDEREEDPNRQGVIRTVKGAHLVYKRATPDGKFEELWIYNISPARTKDEMRIKQAILAGTDIPPGKNSSVDGESSYEMAMLGNAALIKITGLVQ